jgi:ribosomal protein S12 methylthiotransferase
MRTKSLKPNKINVVTLGCSKNVVDSEVLLGQLKADEIEAGHNLENNEANIVVVNTCGFIDNAKQESIDTILAYSKAKENGDIQKLFVTGCLSERYRKDLMEEIPEVDAWFGTFELQSLIQTLGADYKKDLVGERVVTTPSHYAYMKISEGCDRPCSFCAIPLMRGKHVSKSIENLVKEAEHLVSRGVKEIMLIAQDTTYYGLDLYGERRLNELLLALSDVPGIEWIRLHYAYPSAFPLEILETMRERSNICNYLDIPLQHSSNSMLKIMRRGINKKRSEKLIKQIREALPDIALRTTMLVGHPGETEADIEDLADFIKEHRFERLGIFTYSHEEGTSAFDLEDVIPQEIKEERAEYLMAIQQEVSYDLNSQKVGQTLKVVIDREEGGYWVGRSEFDSPEVDNEVLIPTDNNARIGEFYRVEIVDSTDFDLIAKFV